LKGSFREGRKIVAIGKKTERTWQSARRRQSLYQWIDPLWHTHTKLELGLLRCHH